MEDFAVDHIFPHGHHVAVPLRFVGAQGTRRMHYAGRCVPARIQFDPESPGQFCDPRIAHREITQAVHHFFFADRRIKPEIRYRHIAHMAVVLLREKIVLVFGKHADPFAGFFRMMDMMEQRQLIIIEFGIHRPRAVFVHQLLPDQVRTEFIDEILEQDDMLRVIVYVDKAHAFVGARSGCLHMGDRTEPPLHDGPPVHPHGKIIIGMQAQPSARPVKRTRYPRRCQLQDSVSPFKYLSDLTHNVLLSPSCVSRIVSWQPVHPATDAGRPNRFLQTGNRLRWLPPGAWPLPTCRRAAPHTGCRCSRHRRRRLYP